LIEPDLESRILRTDWEIRPRDGSLAIRGDARALASHVPRTAVVVCHGFKAFRTWGLFPPLATALARRGHAAVTFDFTRNGVGPDGVDFSALGLFSENTHSRNLDEIRAVIDAVLDGGLLPERPARIALLGHSRGGAEALLAAAEDGRVDALVTWSAIASIEARWNAEQIATWQRGETVLIPNARTGQEMPVGPGYWLDVLANRERLDVLTAASRLRLPWLIVHGEQDETVPLTDAHTLFAAAGAHAELCLVAGGTHTYGIAHPYSAPTAEFSTALDLTLEWLEEALGEEPKPGEGAAKRVL
jgi:uncharacterized protein